MASSKEYLEFVLEQLAELDEITYRAMMGEYIIYYHGKIVGGIYDDRLLVKPIKSAISYMPTATYELPYDGAKEMLLVEDVDNKKFLTGLFNAMYDELPAPKPKKKKQPRAALFFKRWRQSERRILEFFQGAGLDLDRCGLGREPALFAREGVFAEAFLFRRHLQQADLQQAG